MSHTPRYDRALEAVAELDDQTKQRAAIPIDQIEDKEAELKYWATIAQNHGPERQAVAIRLRAEKELRKLLKGKPWEPRVQGELLL